MTSSVNLMFDEKAEPSEKEAVKKLFEELNFSVVLDKRVYIRRSDLGLPCLLIIITAVATFLSGFVKEAGKDAYIALKEFLAKIVSVRKSHKSLGVTIIIQDEETGIKIFIQNGDITNEASRSLMQINLAQISCGSLEWDDKDKRWRPKT